VHKIKPLFGFVGLLTLQAECQEFENNCLRFEAAILTANFTALRNKLLNIRTLIETEKERLRHFNNG
jgi:hypothetical protein